MQKDTKKTDGAIFLRTHTRSDRLKGLVEVVGNAAKIQRIDLNTKNGDIRVVIQGDATLEASLREKRIGSLKRIKNPNQTPQNPSDYMQVSVTAEKNGLQIVAMTGHPANNLHLNEQLNAIFDATFQDGTIFGDPANQTEALYEGTSSEQSRALVAKSVGSDAGWMLITDSEPGIQFALTDEVIAYGFSESRRLWAACTSAITDDLANADAAGPSVNWLNFDELLTDDLLAFSRSVGDTTLATFTDSDGNAFVIPMQLTDDDGLPQIELQISQKTSSRGDSTNDIVLGVTGARGGDIETFAVVTDQNRGTLGFRGADQISAPVADLARRTAGLQVATQ